MENEEDKPEKAQKTKSLKPSTKPLEADDWTPEEIAAISRELRTNLQNNLRREANQPTNPPTE